VYETGQAASPVVGFAGGDIEHSGSTTRELICRGRLTEWSR